MQNVHNIECKANFYILKILETASKNFQKSNSKKISAKIKTFKKLRGDIKKLRRKKTPIG